jgi:hypothetical protein
MRRIMLHCRVRGKDLLYSRTGCLADFKRVEAHKTLINQLAPGI